METTVDEPKEEESDVAGPGGARRPASQANGPRPLAA